MDKPSSQTPNSNDVALPANVKDDAIDPRMIADSLLSALSSGNLEQLEHTREALVKESRTNIDRDRRLPDLAAQLERRNLARKSEAAPVAEDSLRKEEEDLHRAEQELERRRREVEAAKRKAEAEAKRKAAEAQRRAIEAEAQRRAQEHADRLAQLEALRTIAETAALEAARKEQLLNAEIDALRRAE